MLVVLRRGAICHPLIRKVPEVEDRTSSFKKRSEQSRDSVAKTTRKKCLAELLADERAVAPLLVFSKDTEVGGREGATEKAMEWRQRRVKNS